MKALILMIACLSIALNAGEPDGLVQQTPSAWESDNDHIHKFISARIQKYLF